MKTKRPAAKLVHRRLRCWINIVNHRKCIEQAIKLRGGLCPHRRGEQNAHDTHAHEGHKHSWFIHDVLAAPPWAGRCSPESR